MAVNYLQKEDDNTKIQIIKSEQLLLRLILCNDLSKSYGIIKTLWKRSIETEKLIYFCLVELPYLLLNYCLTYVFLKQKVKERQ